jgi:NADPH:quinone reductase
MVTFGNASGPVPPFAPLELSSKCLTVTRPNARVYVQTKEEFAFYAGETMKLLSSGGLKVDVSKVYDLKDAAKAHLDLEVPPSSLSFSAPQS